MLYLNKMKMSVCNLTFRSLLLLESIASLGEGIFKFEMGKSLYDNRPAKSKAASSLKHIFTFEDLY